MTSFSGTELPWTGGRPWRILDECEAGTHNTLAAGRGRTYRREGGGSWVIRKVQCCTCPGAMHAIKLDNAARRARTMETRNRARHTPRTAHAGGERKTARPGAWAPAGVRMPDFEDAACRSLYGRAVMDRVISSNGGANTKAVKQAKAICDSCPLKDAVCGPYVRAAEQPVGAWYGVWAGMTQAERRAAQGLTR